MVEQPMPPPTPKFRVAIAGAGIGGLALAVTIGKFSKDVIIDLYEAQPAISTIGAGIGMWERTQNILSGLGMEEEISEVVVPPLTVSAVSIFHFRRADQPTEGTTFYTMPHGIRTLHRADMIELFKRHLPPTCTVHLSKRLASYTTTSAGVTLQFSDGSTATADALIGADGVRSPTRHTMFEQVLQQQRKAYAAAGSVGPPPELCKQATAMWSGQVAYRTLLKSEELEKIWPDHIVRKGPMGYSGKGKHVIVYPISQGKAVNFVLFVTTPGGEGTTYPGSWVEEVSPAEVAEHVKDWEPEVQALVKCIEKPTKWAVHVIDTLPLSTLGNVAILGDAAHAMTPHLGSGAGQAIEDAYILGRLLAHPSTTRARIPAVLKIYESARLAAADNVARRSRAVGLMYELSAEGYFDGSRCSKEEEEKRYRELGDAIVGHWQHILTMNTMDAEWSRLEKALPAV